MASSYSPADQFKMDCSVSVLNSELPGVEQPQIKTDAVKTAALTVRDK